MVMSGVFGILLKVVFFILCTIEPVHFNCRVFVYLCCLQLQLYAIVMGGRMENAVWFVAGGIPSGQVRFCREYLEAVSDGKDENILADRHV